MEVREQNMRLGRRLLLCLGSITAIGALTYFSVIGWMFAFWQPVTIYVVLANAASSAVMMSALAGIVAFVYMGLSIGRWLSQRLDAPVPAQFEETEYPRRLPGAQ